MKKQPLKYRLNVLGAAVIIFLTVRTYMPLAGQKLGLGQNFDLWLVWCMLTMALSCLLPVIFIEKMCDFHPRVVKKVSFRPEFARIIPGCMLLFILFSIAGSSLLIPLEKLGINFPQSRLYPIDSPLTLVLYFVFTAAVPAVCEELLVRGEILNLLLPYGKRFAVLASALIFMMMHTQVQSFAAVFGAGVTLACVYLYTDNIYIGMALHFVNNAYSFLMMYMRQKVNAISAASFAAFALALIIGAGGAAVFYMRKRRMNLFEGLKENGSHRLSRIFTAPVLVLAFGCCFMAIMNQLFVDLGL